MTLPAPAASGAATRHVIERLYSCSGVLNDKGQYSCYGRVGGCPLTGNGDGLKHCAMSILYSLQHIGDTIPPQADAGWIGEVTYNLMHLAAMLRSAGGIPALGHQRSEWGAGRRFDSANPEHR